jgi:hypothetical protein
MSQEFYSLMIEDEEDIVHESGHWESRETLESVLHMPGAYASWDSFSFVRRKKEYPVQDSGHWEFNHERAFPRLGDLSTAVDVGEAP